MKCVWSGRGLLIKEAYVIGIIDDDILFHPAIALLASANPSLSLIQSETQAITLFKLYSGCRVRKCEKFPHSHNLTILQHLCLFLPPTEVNKTTDSS